MSETRRLILTNSGMVDLSEYLTKTEAETLYANLDSVNNKQDKLISGTNIKTINGTSILGSGNITIEGGGGSSGSGGEYVVNYPIVESTNYTSVTLNPNEFTIQKYAIGNAWALNVNLSTPPNTNVVNEYILAFYYSSLSTISFPSSIVWGNNDILTIEVGYTYIISIVDNIALYTKVDGNIYNALDTPSQSGGDN